MAICAGCREAKLPGVRCGNCGGYLNLMPGQAGRKVGRRRGGDVVEVEAEEVLEAPALPKPAEVKASAPVGAAPVVASVAETGVVAEGGPKPPKLTPAERQRLYRERHPDFDKGKSTERARRHREAKKAAEGKG